MRQLSCILICLVLAGCVTTPIEPQRAAQYKKIGVLSAMGDRFSVSAVGVTIFGNDYREEIIPMGADELLAAKAKQSLSKRYEVVDLGKYRDDFMKQPKHWPGQKGVFANDDPMVPDVVRQLMGHEKLDAYILITPGTASVRGTNQAVAGNGIVKLQRPFRSDDVLVHAAYIVSVVDGTDFSLAADMRAAPEDEAARSFGLLGSAPISAPSWPVFQKYWENPAENRDQIRSTYTLLIEQSVHKTLKEAKLVE